jgi:hypothetical protein
VPASSTRVRSFTKAARNAGMNLWAPDLME